MRSVDVVNICTLDDPNELDDISCLIDRTHSATYVKVHTKTN